MRRSILAMLLLVPVPALATPRFTARLENVTASEALRRLESFYGLSAILAPGVEGRKGVVVPARATLDWREASLGEVVGDVERVFGLQAVRAVDGSLRFTPAAAVTPALTAGADRVTVALREVRQTETRRKLVGAGTTEVERTLRLTLVIRAKDGEADIIRGVARVMAADERGNRSEAAGVAAPTSAENFPARPDERVVQVELPAPRASASRSIQLEGQVLLSPSARTYRVEFPGSDHAADRGGAGPVRIAALPADTASANASISFALSWPATVRVDLVTGIRCFLRKEDDSVVPVALSGTQGFLGPDGGGSARVIAALTSGVAGTVVWDVTTLDPQDRSVTFRFPRVLLPLSAGPASPVRRK